MFPGNDAPERQALRQALEEKQDPAGDPKVKGYFSTIQDLHSRKEETGFSDLAHRASLQVTSDVIEKLPEQLQPLAADLAENYADVAKVNDIYSRMEEIQEEWKLIKAIKENLEEPGSVLTLKDYTLNNSSACVEFLRLLSHVTELNIEKIGAGDIFSGIGNVQNLQTIRIFHAEKFTSFRGIEALTHLQAIELTNSRESIDLTPLHSMDSLQTVTINGCDVDWRFSQVEEPGIPEAILEIILDRMPPAIRAGLPADARADMLAVLQPEIPNAPDEVQDDGQDDLQELSTTTGGATASDVRQTTSSAGSVDSPFSIAELGQAMVANGEPECSGTLHNDANSARPLGEGTLLLESLDFGRRTQ
ncbi:MAG: hypothetical protein AB2992_02445 [Candidatus Symbiodolus clandestinus]